MLLAQRNIIADYGEYLGWSDGTYSPSCEVYRYPPRFYYYEGHVEKNFFFFLNIFRMLVEFINYRQ